MQTFHLDYFMMCTPSKSALPMQVITGSYLKVRCQDLKGEACMLLRQQSLELVSHVNIGDEA